MNLRFAATVFFGVISFILCAVASGIISANVEKLADKHGWDNLLVNQTEKLRWERIRELWWLWSIFGLSGGIALVLWLIPLLAPDVPTTTFPPATAAPKGEFVKNQSVWREGGGDASDKEIRPAITYYARFLNTGSHLRVFIEYQNISAEKISPKRQQIADIHDYVKNNELMVPVISRKGNGNSTYTFAWGEDFEKSSFRINDINRARIILLGDDGKEQHYYFVVTVSIVNNNIPYVDIIRQEALNFVERWEKYDAQ